MPHITFGQSPVTAGLGRQNTMGKKVGQKIGWSKNWLVKKLIGQKIRKVTLHTSTSESMRINHEVRAEPQLSIHCRVGVPDA